MTTLREAAQQALEALEMSRRFVYADNRPKCDDAIDALRAALAQPKGGGKLPPPPSQTHCPNCAGPETQNTELDRKAAYAKRGEALYHPCTYILIQGLKKLNAYDVLAEWDKTRDEVDALASDQRRKSNDQDRDRPQPAPEPVAKVDLMTTGGNAGLATRIVELDDHLRERLRPGQLLYTSPPQRNSLDDAMTLPNAMAQAYENGYNAGVAHERKACAKLAETTVCDTHLPTGVRIYGTRVAAAIRARGNT